MRKLIISALMITLITALSLPVFSNVDFINEKPWTVTAGVGYQKFNRVNGWGYGPMLTVEFALSDEMGIRVSSTLVLRTDGFYDGTFISGDAGLTFRLLRMPSWLKLFSGGSFFSGSDNDGSLWSSLGVHFGASAFFPLGRSVGIPVTGTLRYWIKDDTSYKGKNALSSSISTGIAFRF